MARKLKYSDYRSLLLTEEVGKEIDEIHTELGVSAGVIMRKLIDLGLAEYHKNGDRFEAND